MDEKARTLVAEFRARRREYERLGRMVHRLLKRLLQDHDLAVQSVTYRVKDPDRLEEKLLRQGKSYQTLDDVTDLLGLRVVTRFADDVDRVARLIDREFVVDLERSVDKRQVNEPDRFGYASVHKICRLPEERLAPDHQVYRGLYFEIQIRSILQHAWAEIEHDLGYKTPYSVPVPLRRRFSMLASLLELADEEFIRLRSELAGYARQLDEDLRTHPEAVLLDIESLRSFIRSDERCRLLDRQIAAAVKARLKQPSNDWLEARVRQLAYVNIRTMKELSEALADSQEALLHLAGQLYAPYEYRHLPRGISLFLLVQVLLGRLGSIQAIAEALAELNLLPRDRRTEWARTIYTAVRGA